MLRSMLKFDTTLKRSYLGKLLFVEGDKVANFVLKSSKAKIFTYPEGGHVALPNYGFNAPKSMLRIDLICDDKR